MTDSSRSPRARTTDSRARRRGLAPLVVLPWLAAGAPAGAVPVPAASPQSGAGASGPALIGVQEAKLVASDPGAGDFFGVDAALAGDTLIVGANVDDHSGFFDNGSAYVYVRSGTSWSEQAQLTPLDPASIARFGNAVVASGDMAVVGAPAAVEPFPALTSGALYVFERSGSSWSQTAKLLASDAGNHDYLGADLDLSEDSLIVGARQDDHSGLKDAGAAYVFVRTAGVWTEEAKLTAADAAAFEFFGYGVALRGDTALVGAIAVDLPGAGSAVGSAYVFRRSGGTWSQEAKLTPSDGASFDNFGAQVTLADEDTAIVGAFTHDALGLPDAGAVYVFTRSGGSWSQTAKITASDAAQADSFGNAVEASGDVLLVGARQHEHTGLLNAGATYVFRRTGGVWVEQTELFVDDPAAGDQLGVGLALENDSVVVGSIRNDHAGLTNAGASYVFRLVDCGLSVPSAEVVRPGTPPNPLALLPGQTSGPVVGAVWDPVIDHAGFLPGSFIDVLGVAALPANLPLPPLGTLLCDLGSGPILFTAEPGTPFAVLVPANCALAGKSLCAQGLSADGVDLALTNALDLTIGTF